MSRTLEFAIDTATVTDIAEHLARCDDAFIPPLSSRTEIGPYAQKVGLHAVRFEAWAVGTLVGLVAAYCNESERRVAYITNVSIEPGYRRMGIGTALLSSCIEHARQRGFAVIELEVDSANTAAIDLYVKRGFIRRHIRGRTVVMRLETGRG